jgi:2'-deoxynucleoside 5'-phosphate N-hydrolase
MKKIYFAGSIRGGRDDVNLYFEIIDYLKSFGEVLTEHVGDNSLSSNGEPCEDDNVEFVKEKIQEFLKT